MRTSARKIIDVVALTLVVLGGVFVVQHRQQLYDFARTYNYQPPTAIRQLAADTKMTPHATNIFYVNHPDLESDKTVFNGHCSQAEQTIVLGCYVGNQRGIFLYDVTDARLAGVEQVTAAHEMLHAAYDRLGKQERAELDRLLEDYFDHDVHDPRIIGTMNLYKQSEPGDVVNEMHSIFGTEIAHLPPALEQHYQRYFKDRQQIVTYSDKYKAEFTSRKSAVQAYDTQLAALKQQIDTAEASLLQQQRTLDQHRAQLDADRSAGNTEAYNAGVASFNTLVAAYNRLVAQARASVAQYNDIVAKRNAIALEEQQLVQALDSHTTPAIAQ